MATQLEIELGVKVIALKELLREITPKLIHSKERTIKDNGTILYRCDLRTCLKCQAEQASKDTIEEAIETEPQSEICLYSCTNEKYDIRCRVHNGAQPTPKEGTE